MIQQNYNTDFIQNLSAEVLQSAAVNHPYLHALRDGDLPNMDLAYKDFALQYGFYSNKFVRYISLLIDNLSDDNHKHTLQHNLDEEHGDTHDIDLPPEVLASVTGQPHTSLFQRFQQAVGVDAQYLKNTTDNQTGILWSEQFLKLCEMNQYVGVGAIGIGTELIVSKVYTQILKSLEAHSNLAPSDYVFFNLHCECDEEHAAQLITIAEELAQNKTACDQIEYGVKIAINLRVLFWDKMLERALSFPVSNSITQKKASPLDTEKVYDENAQKWLRLEPSSLSDFTARPAVFEACGDVNARSVLDIGCGEGYCARELKSRGAGDYLGLDLSTQMINAARLQDEKDQYGIHYDACNVVEFKPKRKYDLCIAVFLFNYMKVEEMQRTFSMVYDALETHGEFIFSVPHPFFPFVHSKKMAPFYFASTGKNYFKDINQQFEGEIWKKNGEPLHVQCVHKTFSNYFDGLKQAGFSNMPEIKELTVTPEMVSLDKAFFSPLLNVPLHVLFKVTK